MLPLLFTATPNTKQIPHSGAASFGASLQLELAVYTSAPCFREKDLWNQKRPELTGEFCSFSLFFWLLYICIRHIILHTVDCISRCSTNRQCECVHFWRICSLTGKLTPAAKTLAWDESPLRLIPTLKPTDPPPIPVHCALATNNRSVAHWKPKATEMGCLKLCTCDQTCHSFVTLIFDCDTLNLNCNRFLLRIYM